MKPFISYYGGKQRMASKIVPLIPPHTVYAEPFAGGLAVMFKKPLPAVTNSHHYREAINDIDERLINFYRVLQDVEKREQLFERLRFTPHSQAEYKRAKSLDAGNDIDRAWSYYVNIMQSFGKKINGGWAFDKNTKNSAMSFEILKDLLFKNVLRLKGAFIDCIDALDFIDHWDSPQTCFYCDPPYPGTDCGHYGNYTPEDFAALVDKLDNCKGSFLLSNYEQPGIPEHWERHEFGATMSAARDKTINKKRTEIVWRVDRSANLPQWAKDIIAKPAFKEFGWNKKTKSKGKK
jgi:DNA adenine methylase